MWERSLKKLDSKSRRRAAKKHCININHDLYTCKIKNCVSCVENYIVNLSDYELSIPEKLLLSKGLTFIPTAKDVDSFELLSDFNNKFACKLRYRIYPPASTPKDGFTLYHKDKYTHKPTNHFTSISLFKGALDNIKIQLSHIKPTRPTLTNLSKRQQLALKNLSKNNNILINKGDKGSTIVIQSKKDYVTEGITHLNDTITYSELLVIPPNTFANRSKTFSPPTTKNLPHSFLM